MLLWENKESILYTGAKRLVLRKNKFLYYGLSLLQIALNHPDLSTWKRAINLGEKRSIIP